MPLEDNASMSALDASAWKLFLLPMCNTITEDTTLA